MSWQTSTSVRCKQKKDVRLVDIRCLQKGAGHDPTGIEHQWVVREGWGEGSFMQSANRQDTADMTSHILSDQYIYRAFSCHFMLSSNMAVFIVTEINIHLCKHLFTLLCITFSPWTSPFVVRAHDDGVRAWGMWLPWISRSVCAIWRPCWRTAWHQWKRSILKWKVTSVMYCQCASIA